MIVEWEIFIWAIASIITLTTAALKYAYDRINEIKIMVDENRDERNEQLKEFESRLDVMENCHNETQLSILSIKKDIEYIRINIDKLLKKK